MSLKSKQLLLLILVHPIKLDSIQRVPRIRNKFQYFETETNF